jgi:probable DNA repair protein
MRLAYPGLMEALAEGVTIVTPTPALASIAIEQFNREQLAQGHESWERPAIHSLDAWMTNRWQDARFGTPNAPLLLSLSQERELWCQIIEADRSDLFDLRAMSSLAQRAARVVAEYQISTDGSEWSEHADAREFQRWHMTMQRRLKAENWITRSDLWRLQSRDREGSVARTTEQLLPHGRGSVAFVALSSISPGLKALSRGLGDSVQNIGINYSNQPGTASAIPFENTALEMEHVARSVRHLLEGGKQSIGILVPDLAAHATDLTRTLREVLYPASTPDQHLHVTNGTWADTPVISNALLLLELVQPRVHHASAGAILRSPFIDGHREERSLRAQADAKLHKARELDFSESEIEKASWDCPILYQVVRKIFKIKARLTTAIRLPGWSAAFSDILETAKWPALDHVTDSEQQAVDTWNNALSELASLGLVSPPVTLNQAISHLRSILSRPSEVGDWSSPVQILDAASSEGIEFEHAFILNACEEAWPPPATLSPLVPYKLQRLHQVPVSTPESLVEERERRTRSLFACASSVQVSYVGNLAPAIRPYVRLAAPELIPTQSGTPPELDSLEDWQAPALPPSEKVRGGASIIKSQSLCPFKAFAEYRLNARGDDEASIGYDALERGECAHKALELIWQELGTQQKLKSLSPLELRLLVQRHIQDAVKEDAASGPIRALTSLAERDRLVNVILQWLGIEKERSAFSVERIEDNIEVDLAGLKLKLRMDRVDRLSNGSMLLIDYKSGAQTTRKLEGPRPQEPQLLVYAAVMDESIDGLYFGELKNRKARPVGHGAQKHFPKQRGSQEHANDWDEFLAASKATVFRLATEFQQGAAAVAPISGACNYCRVKPICRIGASDAGEDEEE